MHLARERKQLSQAFCMQVEEVKEKTRFAEEAQRLRRVAEEQLAEALEKMAHLSDRLR